MDLAFPELAQLRAVESPPVPHFQAELFPAESAKVDRVIVTHVIVERGLRIVFAVENRCSRNLELERASVGAEELADGVSDFASPCLGVDGIEWRKQNGERGAQGFVVARREWEVWNFIHSSLARFGCCETTCYAVRHQVAFYDR